MVSLELTDEECSLLADCIDCFLEGHEEAEEQVGEDRTHSTAERMLQAQAAIRQQRIDLIVLQERLNELRLQESDSE